MLDRSKLKKIMHEGWRNKWMIINYIRGSRRQGYAKKGTLSRGKRGGKDKAYQIGRNAQKKLGNQEKTRAKNEGKTELNCLLNYEKKLSVLKKGKMIKLGGDYVWYSYNRLANKTFWRSHAKK